MREQLSSAGARREQVVGGAEAEKVDLEIEFLRRRAAALNDATKLLNERTDEAVAARKASEQGEKEHR